MKSYPLLKYRRPWSLGGFQGLTAFPCFLRGRCGGSVHCGLGLAQRHKGAKVFSSGRQGNPPPPLARRNPASSFVPPCLCARKNSRAKAQSGTSSADWESGISAIHANASPIRQVFEDKTSRSTENICSISVGIRKRHLHDANIHPPTTSVRSRHRRMLEGVATRIL